MFFPCPAFCGTLHTKVKKGKKEKTFGIVFFPFSPAKRKEKKESPRLSRNNGSQAARLGGGRPNSVIPGALHLGSSSGSSGSSSGGRGRGRGNRYVFIGER